VTLMTREQILAEAKALPSKDREALINDLRQAIDDDLSPGQLAEIHRRIDAVDRGEMTTVDGDQVMRELHNRLRQK
jgi:putative addiction module component (TIGR02574 family)